MIPSSIFKVLPFMISPRYLLIFPKLAFKYGVGNCNYRGSGITSPGVKDERIVTRHPDGSCMSR